MIRRGCASRSPSTSSQTLYDAANLAKERHALGEAAYKREFLGIPAAGQVSPFDMAAL